MQTSTQPPCPGMPRRDQKQGCPPIRKFFLLPLFLILFQSVHAGYKIPIANTGNGWSVASNWLPSGVPQDGDSVLIPVAFTITIKNNIYNSGSPNLFIRVHGTLDFDPSGKLFLGSSSKLDLLTGGKIVSQGTSSELVKIGGVVKYNGQLDGTVNGPAYASAITGESPLGFSPGVLAIRLYSFQAKLVNSAVRLEWIASSDHTGDLFEVQKSNDGNQWNTIHALAPLNNSNEAVNYHFTDNMAFRGTRFYRLLLSNADGKISYSRTIPIDRGTSHIKLFPNPATSEARITWPQSGSTLPVYIDVMNMSNSCVLRKMIPAGDQFFTLDTKNLPAGIYQVSITDRISFMESATLVVTR